MSSTINFKQLTMRWLIVLRLFSYISRKHWNISVGLYGLPSVKTCSDFSLVFQWYMAGKVKITKNIEGDFKKGTPAGDGIPFFEVHCKQQRDKYTKYSALQSH